MEEEEGINPDNNDNGIYQPDNGINENHDESAKDFIVENRTQPTSQLSSPSMLGFNHFTSDFNGSDKCEDVEVENSKEQTFYQQRQSIEHQYVYNNIIIINFRLPPPEKGRARRKVTNAAHTQHKGRKKRSSAERVNSINIPLLEESLSTCERKDENNSTTLANIKYMQIRDDEEDNYSKEQERNIRKVSPYKKRRRTTNNYDVNNQIPPPDPSSSLQQLQQQNQFLRKQLQLQQHFQSISNNNNDKESMEEVPYNDEIQSQQMNRYGDIRDDIPDVYNMSNPPIIDNNDYSSQHYSSPQLLPTPFIHIDGLNVQNYPPVELVHIIEHHEHFTQSPPSLPNLQQQHSEQPLTIPDYDIRIETPPLLPSPTSSPLNNSTYHLGKNQWQSPSKVNEVFKQPEINTTVGNIKANENANANVNVNANKTANDNSNSKRKIKKCNNYDNETLHKVKKDTIEIKNVKESDVTEEDIKKFEAYINGSGESYRCSCSYCHKEVNTYDVCRYEEKIICNNCGIDKINNGEIEYIRDLKGYYDKLPCTGEEIEYKCYRLKHTAPLYHFIEYVEKDKKHKIMNLCRYCRLIKSFEHVISERRKSKKLML